MSTKPVATKESFVLPEYLKFNRHLGSGAYGVVCSCVDERNGEEVAVKKITKVFDRKIITKRTLREIKFLRQFQGHENITSVLDVFKVGEDSTFNEIYVVLECMEADMHQIIRSRQKLTNSHFQYFVYQILRGLKYIHTAGVLHRDLKPGNLLVNSDCGLKICDFGLARGLSLLSDRPESNKGPMTEYVATRWYRAPEIMLSSSNYSKAIDVWSVGCIFAELLGGKVLFPGKDYVQQMSLIINVIGTPNDDVLDKIGSERAKEWIHNMPPKKKIPFAELFPGADPLGIDLLERMLDFDPYTRITVEEALQHKYLELYHDPLDEPSHDPIDFSFETLESIEEMRTVLAKEIRTYRPPTRHTLQRQGSKNLPKPPLKKEETEGAPIGNLDEDMKAMEIDSDIETQLAKGVARPLN